MSKFCVNCEAENLDEAKFCKKCGKQDFTKNMSNDNTENTTDDIMDEIKQEYLTNGQKFKITYFWSIGIWSLFMVGMFFNKSMPSAVVISSLVGVLIVGLLSGLIGMFIPTQKKVIFVSISIFISFIVMAIYGSSS